MYGVLNRNPIVYQEVSQRKIVDAICASHEVACERLVDTLLLARLIDVAVVLRKCPCSRFMYLLPTLR